MNHIFGIHQETANPTHRGSFYAFCTCGWHSLYHRPKPEHGPIETRQDCHELAMAHLLFWESNARREFVGACRQVSE